MVRKLLFILISCFFVTALSNPAWSSVEGTWDVSGAINVKLSAGLIGSYSNTEHFEDTFTFNNDGSFETFDMKGTYLQKKNKYTIKLLNVDIEDYMESTMEDFFSSYGIDVDVHDVVVIKNSFKVTENPSGGTINGTFKLGISMSIYFYDIPFKFRGRASATASFIGTASTEENILGANMIPLSPNAALPKNPFAEIICNEILKSIQNNGALAPR